jgi:hypothetical protein
MTQAYTERALAGIAIILLMCAFAICTMASYYSLVSRKVLDSGPITMDEERFTGIRAILPPRGTVGYLSDSGSVNTGDTSGSGQTTRAYYLTEYFLAPVVVAPDTAHDLVVANFASRSAVATLAAANGLTVERDFLNGVALLRRRPR